MNASASSPWSAQQRRWLQALGHPVSRMAGGEAATEAEAQQGPEAYARAASGRAGGPGRPAAPMPPRPSETIAGADARRVPPAPETAAGPSPAGAGARSGAMRRPVAMPDRLRLALLRASGLDPADPAAQETMAQWPVERLRGDAAAKRAFWPQLRALRKRSP